MIRTGSMRSATGVRCSPSSRTRCSSSRALGFAAGIWAAGYAVVVLLAVAAIRVTSALRAHAVDVRPLVAPPVAAAPSKAIDTQRRLRWLLLAAIPSGLLSAVTTFIATDLVSAPLLWVAPRAIYLGSFIVAFSPRGGRAIGAAVVAAPAMITLLWVPYGSAGGWPILAILGDGASPLSASSRSPPRPPRQDRPDPAHLTEYYLILHQGERSPARSSRSLRRSCPRARIPDLLVRGAGAHESATWAPPPRTRGWTSVRRRRLACPVGPYLQLRQCSRGSRRDRLMATGRVRWLLVGALTSPSARALAGWPRRPHRLG